MFPSQWKNEVPPVETGFVARLSSLERAEREKTFREIVFIFSGSRAHGRWRERNPLTWKRICGLFPRRFFPLSLFHLFPPSLRFPPPSLSLSLSLSLSPPIFLSFFPLLHAPRFLPRNVKMNASIIPLAFQGNVKALIKLIRSVSWQRFAWYNEHHGSKGTHADV